MMNHSTLMAALDENARRIAEHTPDDGKGEKPRAWWRLSTLPECRPCVTTDPEEGAEWRAQGHTVRELGDVAEVTVLTAQRDSLRAALAKVLDTHEAEAKALLSYQNAMDNFFSGHARESRRHLEAMQAASTAEKEARTLLLTLKA